MTDFVVIGGGIAGVSAAAHLGPHGSVILVEMEASLAYHSTGRSAALFVINYGAQGVRPLAVASRRFLEQPPEGSVDGPLISDRGLLWIADETQMAGIEEIAAEGQHHGAGSQLISPEDVASLVPVIRPDVVAAGMFEPSARDIDVAGLHQAFVRIARSHKVEIRRSAPVTALRPSGSGWEVTAGGETISCGAVINASGAWGDHVAALAGIPAVGLRPLRRTAFMVPGDESYSRWPMVADADQRYYFKPDGVQLLASLAEQEPSDPGDPRPRMEDIALAIERINDATTLGIRTVNSSWTGLRTFAPDKDMVIGEEPTAPGFYWLVGQGGTGIQTSPAYGELLTCLVTGSSMGTNLTDAGVDPATMAPGRFRR